MAFSNDGDRIAWTQVEQMIEGRYHKLGYFDVQTDNLTWFNREQWIGKKRRGAEGRFQVFRSHLYENIKQA